MRLLAQATRLSASPKSVPEESMWNTLLHKGLPAAFRSGLRAGYATGVGVVGCCRGHGELGNITAPRACS